MGISERKAHNKELLKKAILRSSAKLFLKEGYENTSIRKIAASIEYSPATIYLYFKDKQEIFLELQREAFNEFYSELAKCKTIKDPIKRLHKNGELYIRFALKNPERYDLMFIASATIDVQGDHLVDSRSFDLLKENISACIKAGLGKNVNIDIAAMFFWSLVHGMATLVIRKRLTGIPKEQQHHLIYATLQFSLNTLKN